MEWVVYILQCNDGSLYTGSTNDIEKRVAEHNGSSRGARYTSGRRPVRLVYAEQCTSRSAALKREVEIKKLSREKKLGLIRQNTH